MFIDMTMNQLIGVFACVGVLAFFCGWIADAILGYSGYGVIANAFILLTGAFLGLYGYNLAGYEFDWYPMVTIGLPFASAAVAMIILSTMKKLAGA